ncbi:MAG: sugar phosphate isomerase/epimerase [Verrucomicrobiae bacterium]|nr:sugar phosphate isomerase/epimerase [Verrucomicrobiae bacterium]
MKKTRRSFLSVLVSATGAPSILSATSCTERLPIAFSTLGCPKWDWRTVLCRAKEYGFSAIELRGLQNELDLTKCAEFSKGRLQTTRADLEAAELKVCCLGSSVRLHEPDGPTRTAHLDEAKRLIELAHSLGAPFVRVFGDQFPPAESQQTVIDRVAAGLAQIAGFASGSNVTVLIESHGDFCSSPVLHRVLERSRTNKVGLLWDIHHTVVSGREKPAETFLKLGAYVRHVHLKDSQPQGSTAKYVLTGTGTVPLQDSVRLLVRSSYAGVYSFEWEKRWHPEIEEPEVAFPHFVRMMKRYLATALKEPD